LDASGSIGKANFQVMTDFVTTIVRSLDISNRNSSTQGTRIGLLTYGDDPQFEFDLNDYLFSDTELLNAINVRFTDGTTNTADAIRWVY
jgi:collagen type VI alpha